MPVMKKSVSTNKQHTPVGKSLREVCPKCACKHAYRGSWCPECGHYWKGSKDNDTVTVSLDSYCRRPVIERLQLGGVRHES